MLYSPVFLIERVTQAICERFTSANKKRVRSLAVCVCVWRDCNVITFCLQLCLKFKNEMKDNKGVNKSTQVCVRVRVCMLPAGVCVGD